MIKVILSVLVAAAITLTAIGAWAANKNAPKLDDQYVKIGTCYVPLAVALTIGRCVTNEEENCVYTRQNASNDCDDANFTPNQDGHQFILN